MSFLVYVKEHLTRLPYEVGKAASLVPYNYRPGIGSVYRTRKREKDLLDKLSTQRRKEFVFKRVKKVVEHAFANVNFYTDLYNDAGIDPNNLQRFEDLARLPIVTRAQLQNVPIESRSSPRPGRYLVNTGGSSGEPLHFYIEPGCVGHEWAHMHHIWAKLGFHHRDLTIVFGGRSDIQGVVNMIQQGIVWPLIYTVGGRR
jgi:phenylacetate-CoA ligase